VLAVLLSAKAAGSKHQTHMRLNPSLTASCGARSQATLCSTQPSAPQVPQCMFHSIKRLQVKNPNAQYFPTSIELIFADYAKEEPPLCILVHPTAAFLPGLQQGQFCCRDFSRYMEMQLQ
jgi:hypothetical protein